MTVSRDAVTWGYRLFLGREPESQDAIERHTEARDERHLAERLIRSQEFLRKRPFRGLLVHPTRLDVDPIDVQLDAAADELRMCLAKIERAWVHLGDTAPHFSVVTEDVFRPENIERSMEMFWASGEEAAEQLIRILKRHGVGVLSDKTCVEYGCGVGRVTMALAPRLRRIYGYDISRTHLRWAEERARQLGVTNVSLRDCSASVLPDLASCDLYYSRLVFQHNPPPVIVELIRRALHSLRAGGLAVFQVPTYISDYRFRLREWLDHGDFLDMEMHCLPQSKIFEVISQAASVPLEVREDAATGESGKMVSNTFVVRKLSAT